MTIRVCNLSSRQIISPYLHGDKCASTYITVFFEVGKDSIYLLDDKCVFEFVGEELGKVSRPLDLRDNTRPE